MKVLLYASFLYLQFVEICEKAAHKMLLKQHPDLAVESQLYSDQQGVSRPPRRHWRRQQMSIVFPCGINGVMRYYCKEGLLPQGRKFASC